MPRLFRIALAVLAAPLALTLAACGDDADEGAPTGEPIAHIAPPTGQSWVETAAVTPEGGYVIGNPDAPLKLVEYASHTCSHCAAFSQEGAAELDEYVAKGIVSYEIRNQIHDALDMTIALLARCGSPQAFHPLANQAWGGFNQVMENAQPALQAAAQAPDAQRFQTIAEVTGLLDFFAARGISRDQALICLADTAKVEQIYEASQTQSDELGITGTPTFILNGRKIEGTDWASVETALQNAGAR